MDGLSAVSCALMGRREGPVVSAAVLQLWAPVRAFFCEVL